MHRSDRQLALPSLSRGIIIIVGGYGSGKSEISVNLSRHLATSQEEPVAIADLDIVNPYFRSREAAEQLEQLGIKPISPSGEDAYADTPNLLPEVKGAIEHNVGKTVLDVGGDNVGARVLSSLAGAFREDEYELLLVLNANRPFTADVESCLKLMKDIESASRLKFTGLISNTHLMEHTTPAVVMSGLELARAVSRETGLPIFFLSAEANIIDELDVTKLDIPVLPLHRLLLKPWEERAAGKDHHS